MTPERWQKAKEIFHSALDRAPGERSAFLANACGGDELLRQEVESLISAHEKDGSFIDAPAYEAAAEILATGKELIMGQRVGHYQILSTLGKGGMGEVYLAEDARLGRKVALKFLPSSFSGDQDRLRRFEREARAASALNHPNILTIYEVGSDARRQITFSPGLDEFPSLSPDGKSVVYSSDQNGSFEIYVRQLTPGGGELQLTNDGQQNVEPSWSPDGQRIAYYSKNRVGIWLVSALGGLPKQLTEFGSRPAWSLDGSLIAFQSGTPGEIYVSRGMPPSTIWTVSSQGGAPRQITQQGKPAGGRASASWSPDGKRIAFQNSDYIFSNIWSVDVAVGEPKKIAQGGSPVYAPDGHIYFLEAANGKRRA